MWPRFGELRGFGLGTPGPLRDELTALVLAGTKVATAGLWKHDYDAHGESIDQMGERQVLLDSRADPVAVVEVTRIEQHHFIDVPWEFADAEGEGFADIDEWRAAHREFYADQGVTAEDEDLVICAWFRVVVGPPHMDMTHRQ